MGYSNFQFGLHTQQPIKFKYCILTEDWLPVLDLHVPLEVWEKKIEFIFRIAETFGKDFKYGGLANH